MMSDRIDHKAVSVRVGAKLREFREASGLLMREVDTALGLSSCRLRRIENGVNMPRLSTILDLLYFYDVDALKAVNFFTDLLEEDMRLRAVAAA
ncbi:helix-turn-helix domain-containing protein [Acetobacter sicerae]|uniref:Helix-turn-helix domain-containing protein n=1 Tax=Acetobacter sicerae TaxID=85325 RepID=A0ABS8VX49_9PROT|nr:helix-turn-helix transcriptional regulator [Acetobacter sicerae]MCE0745553.1 helix-turn-helix domain-containing protein [Acetobacter sicerae]